METRANYALIGVFTLAVIAAAFGFVLWFSGAEKPGGRTTYKIIFTGSISGLPDGGVVLFNGVRVGAVTKIDLLPQDPSRVFALIEVDAKVPVRADTKARL
jgi:phospholipid/cholesterol/gamma-HCH transport system substrate-binding protein